MTSSQVSALATVERLGTPTLGELAASEQVRPPSMTQIVVGLEAAGLVSRQEDDDDRRVVRVTLTAEGAASCSGAGRCATPILVRRLRRLSAEPSGPRSRSSSRLLEHLVEEP